MQEQTKFDHGRITYECADEQTTHARGCTAAEDSEDLTDQ